MTGQAKYERFNIHHRIQHVLLALTFTALVFTGFPLKFAELPISRVLARILGGIEGAGLIHRAAAVILILTGVYHVVYLLLCAAKRNLSWEMMPAKKDFLDVFDNFKYFFGMRAKPPLFERYNYIDKFEYWAVIWGTAVMAITGLVLWFPVLGARYLPVWALDISFILHDWEALLAAVAIFMWHLYNVHLTPEVFPMSYVWLDGTISVEDLKHHHTLEYEKLVKAGVIEPVADEEPSQVTRASADTSPAVSANQGKGKGDLR